MNATSFSERSEAMDCEKYMLPVPDNYLRIPQDEDIFYKIDENIAIQVHNHKMQP